MHPMPHILQPCCFGVAQLSTSGRLSGALSVHHLQQSRHEPRHYAAQQAQKLGSVQALFTVFGFNFPLLVALLQMLVIAPVCYAVARPRLSWDTARSVLPLALVNVTNVVCGLIGELHQALCMNPAGPIIQKSGVMRHARTEQVPNVS